MTIKQNIKTLTSELFFIPKENKELAKQVISLYTDRKIKNFATAKNLFKKLSKILKPDKLKQVELEIKNNDIQHFMYAINLIMWRKADKKEEPIARRIAETRRTRYFKGYKQFFKGPYTLNIPSVKGDFQTTNDQLMNFFSDIKGKFLERDAAVSEKAGRPDTSLDFIHLYRLWNFHDKTIKPKK